MFTKKWTSSCFLEHITIIIRRMRFVENQGICYNPYEKKIKKNNQWFEI